MNRRSKFQTKPVARAVTALVALLATTMQVQAGPGFGDAFDLNNKPFIIQSYFASSPAGQRQWDPATGAPVGYDAANAAAYNAAVNALYPNGYPGTGTALRKFVDALPLPAGHALAPLQVGFDATTGVPKLSDGSAAKYLPVAQPQKWVNPQGVLTGDDYYEIAVVEYAEKFHSDLANPSTLRGYVQIDQFATYGFAAPIGWSSKAVPLFYPDGTPIMVNPVDANGKLTGGAKVQAKAVDNPHYLGPLLTASRHVPTRLKFMNLLPVGRADTVASTRKEYRNGAWVDVPDATVTQRRGDLFLPVDPSIPGAGLGPDGMHSYPQNRALIHLHGGDNPWISDGTPHQWITPAGELDPAQTKSIASDATLDPTMLNEFTRGVGAVNVPDMNDPGAGAMTYYFPNGQSARMEWYHDHSVGMTRLNVYAGMASAYLLTDDVEKSMVGSSLPGADATIPLVLQDKTFVPKDIAFQDGRWNTSAWGGESNMWFPHVYETVQDPNQATNFNAVGRWHWGPWFWPSFPSLYNLPTGAYGDVTTTPEAWQDTPVINGVAYPTLTVDPKPYRLRILNASNDRAIHFNLFVADESQPAPFTHVDGTPNFSEMKMVPINSWLGSVCADPAQTRFDAIPGQPCTPQGWSTDVYGHNGGVPDATTQGPSLLQVASEGGWLPGVAVKDPTPVNFLLDKGRAAVLNVDWTASGLYLGNGERADVVVDFSQYAGKTILVYNDGGAPVPAADPRNEYFTGYGDNSATGGSEDTRPGYGPNSRTLMQIVVRAATPSAAVDVAALDAAVKTAYAASQERPVVAQSAYNGALGTAWTDNQAFAHIYTGSLKEPTFNFVPGTPLAAQGDFNSIVVTNQGDGYTTPPTVTIGAAPAGGTSATAAASLKIRHLHVVNGGAGYKVAPLITITSLGKGSGATATSRLKVSNVQVTKGGTGYSAGGVTSVSMVDGGVYAKSAVSSVAITNGGRYNTTATVTFALPPAGGVRATGTAIMSSNTGTNRQVVGVNITNPGRGYTSAPAMTFSNGAPNTPANRAAATATLGAGAPSVSFAAPAGGTAATGTVQFDAVNGVVTGVTIVNAGAGYATAPTPTFTGGTVTTAATATTTISTLPTVTFAAPAGKDGAGNPGVRATGVAVVNASGVITGINVTSGGTGYTAAPSVTIAGGGGTGATATSFGSVGELVLDIPDPTNPESAGGGGYDNLLTDAADPNFAVTGVSQAGLTLTLTAAPAAPAGAGFTSATATAGATGKVFDITVTKSPVGYTNQPSVTVTAPTANSILSAATTVPVQVRTAAAATTDLAYNPNVAQGSILVKTKAIQELFDPTYGRLNATFGVELPYTSALTQTTIPLGYVDQATEEFQDGETQIWKITHNGVDTHPIHFHLLNVQLVNRVGWDNFITPPEQNELGWKEVIKMSPLEDVIVAVRAKKPNLRQSSSDGTFAVGAGFGLPNSVRRQDPSLPEGAMDGFTQIDPNTGLPATMVNQIVDYGWEYVWHCHILGHEENDFMRPVIFRANEAVPELATGLTAVQNGAAVDIAWTDNASTEYAYQVQRAAVGSNAWTTLGNLVANATKFSDATAGANAFYDYRVVAIGQAGSSMATVSVMPMPTAITTLAATALSATSVRLNWADAQFEQSYTVQRSADGGTTWTAVGAALAANATTVTDNTAVAGTTYLYRVNAVNVTGSTVSNTATVTTPQIVLAAPTNVTATNGALFNPINLTVGWRSVANATGYDIQWSTSANMAGATLVANVNGGAGITKTYTLAPAVATGTRVYVQVRATSGAAAGTWSATVNAIAR